MSTIDFNPTNERIKHQFFIWLKEARGRHSSTRDFAAAAIHRFERYTEFRDFKRFRREDAIAFKKWLAEQKGSTAGEVLSKSTQHGTLMNLKRFFEWLSEQRGYRSLQRTDAAYFSLSTKDQRTAGATRPQLVPTMDQVQKVIFSMPSSTDVEKRNRALIAFILLTGARDGAVASARIGNVDLAERRFFQDAREVNTKFSKTFVTEFFPVGDDVAGIVYEWIGFLKERNWQATDPLFPSTATVVGETSGVFESAGLSRECWSKTDPIREIFRAAFEAAGLPYSNPHSVRSTLARFALTFCRNEEEMKSWSENLGHESVMTTLNSYASVPEFRKKEVFATMRAGRPDVDLSHVTKEQLAEEMLRRMTT